MASPTSEFVGAGGAVVVVVVGGGGGAVVVVVGGGGGGDVVVVVGAGAVVVVVAGGAVVVVVVGAWYATRCDRRFTPSRCDAACTTDRVRAGHRACRRHRVRRGRAVQQQERREEQRAANDCSNAEAPPPRALVPQGSTLLRDTAHPRRHTGGGGFLKNLDNQSRRAQTQKVMEPFCALFPQVTYHMVRDIYMNSLLRGTFSTKIKAKHPGHKVLVLRTAARELPACGKRHGRGRGRALHDAPALQPLTAAIASPTNGR